WYKRTGQCLIFKLLTYQAACFTFLKRLACYNESACILERTAMIVIKQHDFTKGNILKHLLLFSGPIMLTNLLQASYQLADQLRVGSLQGANALVAVPVSSTIVFTVLSFVLGLSNAALTVLSQQKGRGDEDSLKRYLNAFVVILLVMSVMRGSTVSFFSD